MRDKPLRINVIGSSGAGKTTTGRKLAAKLGLPFYELDAFYWEPNWKEADAETFRARIAEAVTGDCWVIDGNYASLSREIVWPRATHVVWVDLNRPTVMCQVIWRSFRRAVSRRELWNGNRESALRWFDRDHPIRWAWRTHGTKRQRDAVMLADPRWSHLKVVRLQTRRQRNQFTNDGSLQ